MNKQQQLNQIIKKLSKTNKSLGLTYTKISKLEEVRDNLNRQKNILQKEMAETNISTLKVKSWYIAPHYFSAECKHFIYIHLKQKRKKYTYYVASMFTLMSEHKMQISYVKFNLFELKKEGYTLTDTDRLNLLVQHNLQEEKMLEAMEEHQNNKKPISIRHLTYGVRKYMYTEQVTYKRFTIGEKNDW